MNEEHAGEATLLDPAIRIPVYGPHDKKVGDVVTIDFGSGPVKMVVVEADAACYVVVRETNLQS